MRRTVLVALLVVGVGLVAWGHESKSHHQDAVRAYSQNRDAEGLEGVKPALSPTPSLPFRRPLAFTQISPKLGISWGHIPPVGQSRRDTPTPAVPETRGQDQPTPRASLPRSTGARYGQTPTPPYAAEARRRGWEGTVLLLVEILENGRPERISIGQSSGHPILDEATLGAVGRRMFIPAQREC